VNQFVLKVQDAGRPGPPRVNSWFNSSDGSPWKIY
jgi:hypothetical protein